MNEKPRSSTCFILSVSAPISFLLGLFIGLVVLGWWLWPVQWTEGNLSVLSPSAQKDYLSAAINSFAFDQDESLAQMRFANLGEGGRAILSGIAAAQPERAAEVERFAAAVGASDVLTAPQTPAEETSAPAEGAAAPSSQPSGQSPLLLGAACLGVLLLLAIIAIAINSANRGRKLSNPVETETTVSAPPGAGASDAFESPAGTQSYSSETLPDWLEPSAPVDTYETIRLDEGELDDEALTAGISRAPTETYTFTEELPVTTDEELTDEDIAAITSLDYSPTTTGLAGAAIFGEAIDRESIHFPGTTDASEITEIEEDTSVWLEEPVATGEIAGEDIFEWEESASVEERPFAQAILADETLEATQAKFSQDISAIEDISPDEAERLRSAGVSVPLLLLKRGATPEGRQELAQESGLSEDKLLRWVNHIDLFRVKGIDHQSAGLLEATGIENINDLADSDPSILYSQILAVISDERTGREAVPIDIVEAWIAQAKKLPQTVYL